MCWEENYAVANQRKLYPFLPFQEMQNVECIGINITLVI